MIYYRLSTNFIYILSSSKNSTTNVLSCTRRIVIQYGWSHARTVVRECCKGDDESQWERVKSTTRGPSHTASAHNQARADLQSHPVQDRLLQRGALRSSDDYHQQAAARPDQCSKDCAADTEANSYEVSTRETALVAPRTAHQIQDSRAHFQGSEHVDAGISQPPHPDVSIYSQIYIQLIYCDLPLAPLKLRPKALYKCNYYYCCYYC